MRNARLSALDIVQLACGKEHGLALTAEGTVLSWGCNDFGALGRATTPTPGTGGAQPMAAFSSSWPTSSSEPNELEVVPAPVAGLPGAAVVTQVAASQAGSFALMQDGKVWGWGTFRVSRSEWTMACSEI